MGAPQEATFPTTLPDELSRAKVFPPVVVVILRIQEAVTEEPSVESPTRGSPESSVIEESTVVAPQFAVLPLIVAERDRISIGGSDLPLSPTWARAQTTAAFVPSADTAMAGFFELNPGAERSVMPPQDAVVPLTAPDLVLIMFTPPEDAFDQTTVTSPPEEDIPSSGSSTQVP